MAVRLGDLVISTDSHRAFFRERELPLRPMEFRLLLHLVMNTERVQTREALLQQVWDGEQPGGVRTVDVHMARLRRALGDAAEAIVTVRRVGYRLDEEKLSSPRPGWQPLGPITTA